MPAADTHHKSFDVTTDFPGGNGIIESIDGGTIRLRPDLRDTAGNWFYWSVRVRNAAGRTLQFIFTEQSPLTFRGPALSVDGGLSWKWLGRSDGRDDQFTLTLPPDADDVLLSLGMNYMRSAWDRFVKSLPADAPFERDVLCRTRHGREVPLMRLGRLDGQAPFRILLTARHHACEMMASHAMEGFLAAALGDDGLKKWYGSQVDLVAAPFMDTDGVEEGDQGKNRRPRDHNRDYNLPHAHVETVALMERATKFFDGRPGVFFDLHCPWIRGAMNEHVYQVGRPEAHLWARQQQFGRILEKVRVGSIPYRAAADLPFGEGWNAKIPSSEGMTSSQWMSALPGVQLVSTWEIPYSTASQEEVNQSSARALGRDMAVAIKEYLSGSSPQGTGD